MSEDSVERLFEELRNDAATWISTGEAAEMLGCSVKSIPGLVAQGLVLKRQGPRCRASIHRESAQQAGLVLTERREASKPNGNIERNGVRGTRRPMTAP